MGDPEIWLDLRARSANADSLSVAFCATRSCRGYGHEFQLLASIQILTDDTPIAVRSLAAFTSKAAGVIKTGLRRQSPQNGNTWGYGRRLPAISHSASVDEEAGDENECVKVGPNRRLAGWGARYRTSEFQFADLSSRLSERDSNGALYKGFVSRKMPYRTDFPTF